MAQWALSRLGETLINLIGESWANSISKAKEEIAEFDQRRVDGHSIPAARRVPLGFLFNSAKSENIVRELLNEFESKFNQYYGEMMTEKLGISHCDPRDFDTLINPLLDLLAQTGADYTTFFRALCELTIFETESDGSKYDPDGIHNPQALRTGKQNTCLGILLQGLLRLQDADSEFVAAENEKRAKLIAMGAKVEIIEPLPFPTLEEVANNWKLWLPMYRSRLVSNLTAQQKSSTEMLKQLDQKRQLMTRKVNPKFTMRGWILEHISDLVQSNFAPDFEMKSKSDGNAYYTPSSSQVSAMEELNRLFGTLVLNAFGDKEISGQAADYALHERLYYPPEKVRLIHVATLQCILLCRILNFFRIKQWIGARTTYWLPFCQHLVTCS
jgi:uncharacterized protein YdiU (UPF0061 family)